MSRLPALGNVVVATDFTARGRIAIERAASLPFSPGGRLEIVHVATPESSEAEIRQRLDAVGSGGKGLVRRALLGSVAERIIHEGACDVLVARLAEV